jgi:anti-sigma factor (TIGR02949 family)
MLQVNDMAHDSEQHNDSCLEAFDYLYAYLNGELKDEAAIAKLEHHLSHCKSCFSRAQMEKELNKRMKPSDQEKAPTALKTRLQKLMDEF